MDWRHRGHRRRSLNVPGHAHELTFTCYRRFTFLNAERTCQWLADQIDKARQELDFALWAYVFMPEHVHLIVYPRQQVYDTSLILQAIKEPVGRLAVGYLREHAPAWLERIRKPHGRVAGSARCWPGRRVGDLTPNSWAWRASRDRLA